MVDERRKHEAWIRTYSTRLVEGTPILWPPTYDKLTTAPGAAAKPVTPAHGTRQPWLCEAHPLAPTAPSVPTVTVPVSRGLKCMPLVPHPMPFAAPHAMQTQMREKARAPPPASQTTCVGWMHMLACVPPLTNTHRCTNPHPHHTNAHTHTTPALCTRVCRAMAKHSQQPVIVSKRHVSAALAACRSGIAADGHQARQPVNSTEAHLLNPHTAPPLTRALQSETPTCTCI